MRLPATLSVFAMLAASGLAGQELWQVWQAPIPPRSQEPPRVSPDPVAPPSAGTAAMPVWPTLFGTVIVPEPQPPKPPEPEPEPQPPPPAAPPLNSLGYTLTGVLSDGTGRWAFVAHPTGSVVLQVGDQLSPHYTVSSIDAAGLWVISAPGAKPELLNFAK